MKPIRMIRAVSTLLLFGMPAAEGAWGQVTIVREVPVSPGNAAQAEWGAPLPSAAATGPGRSAALSGFISAGGSGGFDAAGVQTLDAFIDTDLSLLLPLDAASNLLFTGSASRKPGLAGLDQLYKAGMKLSFKTWQVDAGGVFQQKDSTAASDMAAEARAALTLGFIPTLPIVAGYTYQLANAAQTGGASPSATQKNEGSHHAQLKAVGSIGSVGIDSGASFADITDYSKNVETMSVGGAFGVTVPIASFLKAYASLAPKYSSTAYSLTGNGVTATSLESGLGVILPIADPFSVKIGAGRVDAWQAQTGPSADPMAAPYTVTWKGVASAEWKQTPGIETSTSYTLAKTFPGPLSHSVEAKVAYTGPKDGALKQIGASGSYTPSFDDSGTLVDSSTAWKASLGLGSKETVSLTADYSGSIKGIADPSWSNAAHAGFSQQLMPELSYGLDAGVSGSFGAGAQPTLDQQYSVKGAFTPKVFGQPLAFGMDETLGLSTLASPMMAVSKAGLGVSYPVLPVLSVRYKLDWEWDSQTAPGAGADSSFRHVFGVSAGGGSSPFTVTAEYDLTHGFRGLRHDVSALLAVALWQKLSIQGSIALSEYETGGVAYLPFISTLSGKYTF